MTGAVRDALTAVVRAWGASADVAVDEGAREGESVVVLPGRSKLRTTVSLLADDRGLSLSAFVVRAPDENHAAFYRHLLRRGLRLPGAAFALDDLGDVYLTARLPAPGVTIDTLDDLLGVVLTAADESFDELLTLGFASAIRREWAWRLRRGESTANLAAFEHLRPASDAPPPAPGA